MISRIRIQIQPYKPAEHQVPVISHTKAHPDSGGFVNDLLNVVWLPMPRPILCPGRPNLVGILLLPIMLSSLSACALLDEIAAGTVRVDCSPAAPLPIPANRTISIKYTEPKLQQNGQDLAFLSHTTIYYDAGRGVREYTKHSATTVTGGGPVARDVIIPAEAGNSPTAKICVTATNSAGEGPPAFMEAARPSTP